MSAMAPVGLPSGEMMPGDISQISIMTTGISAEGMPNMSIDGMPTQEGTVISGEVPLVMESSMNASDQFEVTYIFQKPVLIRGYILETANERAECDPKDWVLNVHNCETNESIDIHEVNSEAPRDRWVEKIYRIP